MASTPATNAAAPAASFKPFFQRISQGEDRHADVLACCAMLCNKSLAEIFKQAETLGLPKVGPYWLYADGDFIARLLGKYHWIAYVGLAIILYVSLDMIYRGTLEIWPYVNGAS